MVDDALYRDPAFARFYDPENGWQADTRACLQIAETAGSILDLGCGTGLLARALAEAGKRVTGLDPARAMLEIARAGSGGEKVRWVEADARDADLGETFDLVVMTGHAFQVFLTDADRRAVLATVARHLARRGRFIFDSRNPRVAEWREWTPAASLRRFNVPGVGMVQAWNDVEFEDATGLATYATFYDAGDGSPPIAASSVIAFPDQGEIAAAISAAGLEVAAWWGDWSGAPMTETSPEIIVVGHLRACETAR